MISKLNRIAAILCAAAAPAAMHGQITIARHNVQIHGFASQGFAYTDQNNYLSMNTTNGSFALTDGGVNASTQLTDNFRVGAQMYVQNMGKLGNWHPQLDWAFGDYKFADWFGIRAGKVKTVLGLYNDTQDMTFLHTWALLPQSVYPLDVRSDMISHIGGDLYGNVAMKKLGSVAYTVYGGKRPNDSEGGFVYALSSSTKVGAAFLPTATRKIDSYSGPIYGADLRWTTPLKGVTAGVSYSSLDITTKGSFIATAKPYRLYLNSGITAYYVQYMIGNLRLDGEYRRELKITRSMITNGTLGAPSGKDIRSGYVSAAYRVTKRLEFGTYHSRFYDTWDVIRSLPGNHVFDQAVTARIDLKSYLDLKIEGHFIDGYVQGITNRGFYIATNRGGLQPDTRLLVLRLGFHL